MEELLAFFELEGAELEYEPRFNVAPTQEVPVAVLDGDGRRQVGNVRWGLIPWWADDPAIGNRLINARAETVSTKPAFRDAFARHRCLVLASGFFEWRAGGGPKTPFWIHPAVGTPMAFAGVWDRWRPEGGHLVHSFAIVTREAVPDIRSIHERMPVILPPAAYDAWMARDTPAEALAELLAAPPLTVLAAHEVSTHVNKPVHDDPECIRAVEGGERLSHQG